MTGEPAPGPRGGLPDWAGPANVGHIACLLGVLAMLAGRFTPGAPRWLIYVGVSGVVFGWGLFVLAWRRRAALTRANPRRVETGNAKS